MAFVGGTASYLGVDICDVSSLLGVVAFVDGVRAVEVLADDLVGKHIFACGGASSWFTLNADGSGLALNLVHLAQGVVLGPKGGHFLWTHEEMAG